MNCNPIVVLGLLGLGLVGGCGGSGNNDVTTVPIVHLTVTLPAATALVGTPFTFTVTALDATNAVVPTYVGTVRITTSDQCATLPANSKLAQGAGTFAVTFFTGGSQTITASDTIKNATPGISAAFSVSPGLAQLFVEPASVTLSTGGSQAFTVSAIPQGCGTSNLEVTWSVQEGATGGSITSAGFYTAPVLPGTYHVVATSVADRTSFATATIDVLPGGAATTPTGSMKYARGAYTATLLADGKVLIAGGDSATSTDFIVGISSAELYDPSTGTFASTGPMTSPRYAQAATVLPNGKVLVTGGLGDGGNGHSPPVLRSAELYDPATSTFTTTGSMLVRRTNHTATLLTDGRVLIVGGIQDIQKYVGSHGRYPYAGNGLTTAEIYDAATGAFIATGSMTTGRYGHTATLLANGTVLITGGNKSSDGLDGGIHTSTAEIYDPTTRKFKPTGTMRSFRDLHAATLLNDGKVLVTGGSYTVPNAEIFNPATGKFSSTGSMAVSRSAHSATRLGNGEVLVAGGAMIPQCIQYADCGVTAVIEIFDPASGKFTPKGSMNTARSAHTATLLNSGEVLLAGGEGEATAELYP